MAGYSVTFTVVDQATKQIDAINRRMQSMRAPMERLSKQVSRFVDVSGLNTVAKGFATIGRAAMSVLRTLVEIVPVMGALTGAATIAGMAKLVSSYADWSQTLAKTADSMGMTTKQVQQFEDAARLAGGRASDMDEALKSLYEAQGNFITGKGGDATLWANRLGISFKDATGHARSMADLMPEVQAKIAAIKDPFDRAAAATALLGSRGNELIETFRISHQSFSQWLTDAARYTELTDKQKGQLQSFSEAQGRVGVAFDHLGQQISAMMAEHFTPLLQGLAKFVEKHTPDILRVIGQLSTAFSNWVTGITWNDVENGLTTIKQVLTDILGIMKQLKGYWDDLNKVGEYLTGLQKTVNESGRSTHDWIMRQLKGIGVINQESNPAPALAPPTAGPQQHGALARPGGNQFAGPGATLAGGGFQSGTESGAFLANRFAPTGAPTAPAAGAPAAPAGAPAAPAGGVGQQPGAPVGVAEQQENLRRAMDEQGITDPSMRAGIAAIASGEGGFKPRSEQGYGRTSNDRIRGIFGGRVAGMSDAELTQLKGNDEAFFNKVYGGRLGNAANEGYKYRGRGDFQLTGKGNYERYGKMIGVDLVNNPDLANDPAIAAKIAVAYMKDRYKGGGFEGMKRAVGNPVAETEAVKNKNYAEYMQTGQFAGPAKPLAPATATANAAPATPPAAVTANAAPATPPPAAALPSKVAETVPSRVAEIVPSRVAETVPSRVAPYTSNVDVNITGKNLPPNTAVTAKGSGNVNVPPPRIEHQEMMSI